MIESLGDKYTSSSEFEVVYQSAPEPKMRYELSCGHDYRFHPDAIEEVNKRMEVFIDKLIYPL
jgi:hypothetical protein